jgi:hypothetical protein
MTLEVQVLTCDRQKKTITYDVRSSGPDLGQHMFWSFLCVSQVRTSTSNVICYDLFVSVTSQDLNL